MRIALINQPWDAAAPPASSLSIWSYEVARQLAGTDEVIVYGRSPDGTPRQESIDGVEFRHMPDVADSFGMRLRRRWIRMREPALPDFASGAHHLGYMLSLARDVAATRCDVVHLFNFSQFVPIFRRHSPRARIILNMQCEWLTQLDPAVLDPRIRQADVITGSSDYIADKVKARFPGLADRCGPLHNGVDVEHFSSNGSAQPGERSSVPRLLFVGRVSPEKGVHVLIEAMARAVKVRPDLQLDIVGPDAQCPLEYIVGLSDDPRVAALAAFYDGHPYSEHLREQAARLGLQDRVHFAGFVPHADAPGRYHQANALVNPSFSESFGMALVEAMASGIPVVATRIGGMANIVRPGENGLLVEAGDAEALADAIVRVLRETDVTRRMVERARHDVEERFSWPRIAERLRTYCRSR